MSAIVLESQCDVLVGAMAEEVRIEPRRAILPTQLQNLYNKFLNAFRSLTDLKPGVVDEEKPVGK